MNEKTTLQAQLVELQTQVAFQEDSITQLNRALVRQQQDLSALLRQWELLKDQYAALEERLPADSVSSEKPPHY